jgi:hypothetical protein
MERLATNLKEKAQKHLAVENAKFMFKEAVKQKVEMRLRDYQVNF